MNAIEPNRIISLDNPSEDEDRITLIPNGEENAFVPSDLGEDHAIFLTDEEKNFLSRVLSVHGMKATFDTVVCASILRKLREE